MSTRILQVLVVLAGLAAAAGMLYLGRWQLGVYQSQGTEVARTRAEAPAVPLANIAPPGQPVTDGYGRRVTFTGRYLPAQQVALPAADQPGRFRVLAPVRTDQGPVVAVVRGLSDSATPPPPPTGPVTGSGILLPAETPDSGQPAETAVRLPVLAQTWPGPLLAGFVTLDSPQASAQGLQPAVVALPEAPGRLRNGAYAAQWVVFAAFAIGMGIKMAQDLGRREEPSPASAT